MTEDIEEQEVTLRARTMFPFRETVRVARLAIVQCAEMIPGAPCPLCVERAAGIATWEALAS